MGYLNLMREEADTMGQNSVRSLALLSVLIVFAFLLIGGGPRLIGHENEYSTETLAISVPLRAALSEAPQWTDETKLPNTSELQIQRRELAATIQDDPIPSLVVSDANGNVLRGMSYMQTVYQSFSLGDGFV